MDFLISLISPKTTKIGQILVLNPIKEHLNDVRYRNVVILFHEKQENSKFGGKNCLVVANIKFSEF